MKQLSAILLAVMLLLSACHAGPSAPSPPEEPTAHPLPEDPAANVALSFWIYPVGGWENAGTVAGLISDFHKAYPHIDISVEYLDYETGDVRMEEAIASGEAPDLVLEGPERLTAVWGRRGLMADLSDLWENEDRIYDSVRRACRDLDGSYYIYPLCMTTHCMAVNRNLLEAAGALQYIDLERRTWTTDGFLAAVEALRAYGVDRIGAVYCGGQGGDQGTRALVNNLCGGSFTNETHSAYQVDSPENIRALELLLNLEGIDFDSTLTGAGEAALFAAGELAMSFCWNVAQEVTQSISNPHLNFDILPVAFPSETGEPRLQGGIWGFGVFDHGDEDKIQAAKTFIRFMTDSDSQYAKAVQTAVYWPVRDLPDIYTNDALMQEYSVFTQYMGDYYQITPNWSDARTAWWQMLHAISEGEDVTEAVRAFDLAVGQQVPAEELSEPA